MTLRFAGLTVGVLACLAPGAFAADYQRSKTLDPFAFCERVERRFPPTIEKYFGVRGARGANTLKIIGDFYLAKVYESAVEQLRIPAWKASVTRKQQVLGDVYGWLKGEVDTARSFTLELMIVLLIVVELLVAAGSLFRR